MNPRCFSTLLALAVASLLLPLPVHGQKLMFVVRHAERADSGTMQKQAGLDPPLSEAGILRAEKLARMLSDAGIRAIYVTEYRRTQDTARPLATKIGVAARQIRSRDTAALLAEIRGQDPNDVVLVVGHSNTLPEIIKGFGGPEITIADGEYDNLFVIVPATRACARIRFSP